MNQAAKESLHQIDQLIGKCKGEIIQRLTAMADDYEIGKVFERSPLKNVLSVANEATAGPEEVVNFIRYQLGRSTRNEIWARPSSSNQRKPVFAEALAAQVGKLSEMAVEITDKASFSDRDHVHIKLIRLYLGYLGRYHTYLKWQHEQQRIKGGR